MRPFIRGDVAIRGAAAGDAAAIAAAHVAAWRETYSGLMPASVLQGLNPAQSQEQWRRSLADAHVECFVAETTGAGVFGFASAGPQRSEELAYAGEIYTLYLMTAWQRRGIGTTLLGLIARALDRRGLRSASLWVLKDNSRARLFYERHGAGLAGERQAKFGPATLTELAYGWDDVRVIFEGAPKRR